MPLVRVEIVLQTLLEDGLATLLVRRAEKPYEGCWALPGGVLRVDLDVDLESSARRVLFERLKISPDSITQLLSVGSSGRDPRGAESWGLSVVFRAMASAETLAPISGKRVTDWRWFVVDHLPEKQEMAFDHLSLANEATRLTREEFRDLRLPNGIIPSIFTLSELQRICEEVEGTKINKSNFRRKLHDRAIVIQIKGAFQSGLKNRPAALYRLRSGN